LGIAVLAIIIAMVDVITNRGKEYGVYRIPYLTTDMAMREIHHYFLRNEYECLFWYNQIKATKGNTLLMGVRTFILTVEPAYEGGSVIKTEMYLEGLLPKYMKFSKWGYLAIIPRRMGRRRKEELFQILGVTDVGGLH
jgi:hypothetical protein